MDKLAILKAHFETLADSVAKKIVPENNEFAIHT